MLTRSNQVHVSPGHQAEHIQFGNCYQRPLPREALRVLLELVGGAAPPRAASKSHLTRFRLFDEITRFMAAAGGDAPRLILADDVHWADTESLELFAHAARALRKQRVMLVIAMRDHDRAAQGPRADALHRLDRQATRLELSGLCAVEVEALAAAWGELQREKRA